MFLTRQLHGLLFRQRPVRINTMYRYQPARCRRTRPAPARQQPEAPARRPEITTSCRHPAHHDRVKTSTVGGHCRDSNWQRTSSDDCCTDRQQPLHNTARLSAADRFFAGRFGPLFFTISQSTQQGGANGDCATARHCPNHQSRHGRDAFRLFAERRPPASFIQPRLRLCVISPPTGTRSPVVRARQHIPLIPLKMKSTCRDQRLSEA